MKNQSGDPIQVQGCGSILGVMFFVGAIGVICGVNSCNSKTEKMEERIEELEEQLQDSSRTEVETLPWAVEEKRDHGPNWTL